MKNLFALIVLTVFMSCSNNTTNSDGTGNKKIDNNSGIDCNAEDILILTRKDVKAAFFQKLDSVSSLQYPKEKENQTIDITPELLNQFLSDLNINNLKNDSTFQKKYDVKPSPKNIKIWNESNTIKLMYFLKDCTYRLSVNHYYETKEYANERNASYSFKIKDGHITEFKRQEAG